MTVLAALLLGSCFAAPPPDKNSRAWLAEVEIEGPIADIVLDMGASGETRLVGALVAGETRRLSVPLPARAESERFTPAIRSAPLADVHAEAQGAVRFVRWLEPPASDVERLPPGLRARARPPVARSAAAPSTAALLALAALGLTALGLAERARIALLVAVPGAAALWWFEPVRSSESAAHVILVEGDSTSPTWLEVEAACDRLEIVPPIGAAQIEVWPQGARLVWRVPLEGGNAFQVFGREVQIYRLSAFEPGDRHVDRRRNHWAAMAETWVREAGEWRAHGSWPLDLALPPALDDGGKNGGDAPPGWLASGLPQGPTILVARMSPGGGVPSGGGADSVYLRLTNFD